ncbi:MAG: hypothetical protein ACLUTA_14065 [Blautia wexlerae]
MLKIKTVYFGQECGYESAKWMVTVSRAAKAWNTFVRGNCFVPKSRHPVQQEELARRAGTCHTQGISTCLRMSGGRQQIAGA